MRRFVHSKLSPPVRLALVYLLFSTGWILLSDALVLQFHYNAELTSMLQNIKGLLFVFMSSLLLFYTSFRIYRQLQQSLAAKDKALLKLTALNEAIGEGLIDYDFQTDTARINPRMGALLHTGNEVLRNFQVLHQERIHPDDREPVLRQFHHFLKSGERIWQTEYRYRDAEGRFRDMISRGYLHRNAQSNRPVNMVFALKDVTELRSANARFYQQQIHHRQELTRSILKAQEEERNRWAEELHDNVCQVLTVAKLYQEQVNQQIDPVAYQQKALEMVNKAIRDIRQLSALLKPPEFSLTTLYEAIEVLLLNLQRFNHIRFTLHLPREVESKLQLEHKIMLYRVVQEGLNNVLKYAAAEEVNVSVAVENDLVRLVLEDDGNGFDPEKTKTGIGLQNIRSRLSAYAGNLTLESSPGNGCRLTAEFWI